MILSAASSLYGSAAAWRRRWYARDPARRRRLSRPVVSVGNLRAGGTGKTPVVERIARLLMASGERPAILTRGYARRVATDGTTVVSDGVQILADVGTAGDEPLMLARALPGVPVLVGADRYLSGRLAERRFSSTIHLLDDGFQHLALARDVDLLLSALGDLTERTLPAGRLREPTASASAADALLVTDGAPEAGDRLRHALNVQTVFQVRRLLGPARWVGSGAAVPADQPILAVAGIARPERFFDDLAGAGWQVRETMAYPDHHWFTDADVDRIAAAARASDLAVLTTEKDAVRLETRNLNGLRLAAVGLTVAIEPPAFIDWLLERIQAARAGLGRHAPIAEPGR